tara:strand:- start:1825 stop:2598 length:774 start_codon:yes stop_codon:yes gene_type:complete
VTYASGAAGKMICNIIQQSDKYDNWYSNRATENLNAFCKATMPSNLKDHLRHEINQPYKLHWYSREMPYTRGDDLTVEQVNYNIKTHNSNIQDKQIVLPFTKVVYPQWFGGKIIKIVNDKNSLNFLKARRDEIFYKWIDDHHVNFLMRDPNYHDPKLRKLMRSFTDTPPNIVHYRSKEDFYNENFYKNKEILFYSTPSEDHRIVAHINLNNIIENNYNLIINQLEESLKIRIKKSRAIIIFDNWQIQNKKLLDKMGE